MGFSPAGGKMSGASDVAFNNPANGHVITYNGTTGLWSNAAPSGGGLTATKNTATFGNVTLTSGSSSSLQKFAATLSADRTITLVGTTANAGFDLSFIETNFNGFSVAVTNGTFTHVFSYPTYLRYVYIGSAWERVL